MEEIDYLISLLNRKQNVKGVQKLSQVDYYMAEEDGNRGNTPGNLVLPTLGSTTRSKTETVKNMSKISKINKLKPIKMVEKK
jgi:hypothetical protein